MASMHFEPDNSSVADSLKMNHFVLKNTLLTDSVINYGKIFLNTPYHYGSGGTSSFDCSGFTSYVFRNFGFDLDRSSSEQSKQFDAIDRTELKTGDLVFFSGSSRSKRVGHVGIVVSAKENGEFDFIHAAVHSGVTISSSNEGYYTKRFLKASRVIGANQILAFSKIISKSEKQTKDTVRFSPVPTPVRTIKKIIPAEYHHVKSGETLSSISKKYGMSIPELKRKNNLKGNKLSLKQSLMVKDEETETIVQTVHSSEDNSTLSAHNSTSKNTESSENDKNLANNQINNLHSVKKGETLFSISKLYNKSIDELKKINNIIKGKIHPGQQLIINQPVEPGKNETFAKVIVEPKQTTHKVISGESLFSISKANNIPVDELKRINNITNEKIHAGQELKIEQETEIKSGNTVTARSEKKQEVTNENIEKTVAYKIKKGDNLGAIAKENNTTANELMRINNLSNSKIHEGQILNLIQYNDSKNSNNIVESVAKKQDVKIDTKEKTLTYKIKKGENLGSIAKNNNISVEDLKKINHLSDTKIKPGQELILNQSIAANIPDVSNKVHSKSIQHKVKSGESFYTIAKIYGCSVVELKEWNRKSGSKIKVGENITVFQKASKKDLSLVE